MSELSDREIRAGLRGAFGGPDSSILRRLGITPPKGVPTDTSRSAGRYRIGTEIARGGVGVVYLGHDIDLGREVAMKVLREEYCEDPAITARFTEEAQIGGQLQHPGIAPVYEFGLDEKSRPYFAMKLIKGHTLASLWEQARGDRLSFLPVFEKVCQTMAYAHARGVVHRDLKPANVMVGAFGEVQIVDWGFAKVLGRPDAVAAPDLSVIATRATDDSKSEAGSILGTPAYMPPEQALGQIDLIDERADVFSLGAMLYELLTGRAPYSGEDRLIRAARGDVDLAALEAAPAPLADLARACLAAAPGDRPRSAEVVAEKVADYLASVDEQAHAARVERARAEVREVSERRKRKLTLSMILCMVAATAVGGLAWATFDRSEQRARVANQRASRAAIADAHRRLGEGDVVGAHTAALRALQFEDNARARQIEADVREAADAARAQAERDARERQLVARVDDLLGQYVDQWNTADYARRYRAAFKEAGFDPYSESGRQALAQCGERARVVLAAGLGVWATCRSREHHADRELLMTVASEIDPDPWRQEVRANFLKDDPRELWPFLEDVSQRTEPADFFVLARAFQRFGSRHAAHIVAEAGVLVCPDSVGLRLSAAQSGPPQQRIAHLLAARSLLPDDHPSIARVVTLLRNADPGTAIPVAEEAIARLSAPSVSLLRAHSSSLGAAGRHEESIAAARLAVERFPQDVPAQLGVARRLDRAGRTADAAEAFKAVTQRHPNDSRAWTDLTEFELRNANFEAAKRAALRARECARTYKTIRLLAVSEYESGDYAAAIETIDELAPYPRHVMLPLVAMAYWKLGDKEKARELVKQVGRTTEIQKRAHALIDGKD